MLPIVKARPARRRPAATVLAVGLLAGLLGGCGSTTAPSGATPKKSIVVTYSMLGSLVRDAVGASAAVTVLIPNGSDPHEWEPSAKDIERLNKADLIIRNGLDLEGGMQDALDLARRKGVATFVASDHITVRIVGDGEGHPTGDPDQATGAQDPHLWMDPITLKAVIVALGPALAAQGIDVEPGTTRVAAGLDDLDAEVASILASIPSANRKLVTGHESLGYLAQRYQFQLIGAIIPSLTTQAAVSAEELSRLAEVIKTEHIKAIFTEVGTPKQVVEAIGKQTHVQVVELASHKLPPDGTYASFLLDDAHRLAKALA